jgi:hypothetical protein
MKSSIILFLSLFSLNTICLAQTSEKRVALVIGDSAYQKCPILTYTKQDALTIRDTLEALNFDVMFLEDATLLQMRDSFIVFTRKARSADIRLIYFSGHGSQINGKNYLQPIDDKNINDEISLTQLSINIDDWVSKLEANKEKLNIIILDACRTNNYQSTKGRNPGLKRYKEKPNGTIIAFSTKPDCTADDNGLYAKTLSIQMKKPQRIEDVFINTRRIIKHETSGWQTPMEWSNIVGEFYLTSTPPPHSNFKFFLEKSKNIWLVSALTSSVAGTYSWVQAESTYKKYQTATTNVVNLHKKIELYDVITPIAFSVAGFCTFEFIWKSVKDSKVKTKQKSLNVYPLPIKKGGGVGLVYNF